MEARQKPTVMYIEHYVVKKYQYTYILVRDED